jgi:RHH-type transcriptional regulator, rel operon repressor / antitoxin RelB
MLAIRLPPTLEGRLKVLSEKTGRSKSYYARQALEEFLEDREDYLLAVSRLEEQNPRIPFKDVRRLVELDD